MEYKEIVDLIKLVNKTDLTEVKLEKGDFKINIRTKNYHSKAPNVTHMPAPNITYPSVAPPAAVPQAEQPTPKASVPDLKPSDGPEEVSTANLLEIKSPIVGTFYRSSSPDKAAFAKVGDAVEVGSVVCIVEAMKLFNEIESEVAGKVVKVLVEDASPVEYDQVLFLVDPS